MAADRLAWSQSPPAGSTGRNLPQLVTVSFDDNFGLESAGAHGGVAAVIDYYRNKRNPPGLDNPADYDGALIRTTFFDTTIYMAPPSSNVLGGASGEDSGGRNRAAWRAAAAMGQEIADHTVNHFNGGVVPLGDDPCCRPRDWAVAEWAAEIGTARTMLTDPKRGVGVDPGTVVGFRAPYLGYNDAMFTALQRLDFRYDSSLPNCFEPDETARSCGWPYTLDDGSPDVTSLQENFAVPDGVRPRRFPAIGSHAGLWEVPPTTLVVPPDDTAGQYQFAIGLRDRIGKRTPMPYPSLYDPSTGKIVGMDYTLLVDAGVTGDEMRAILEYNLDQHLIGNNAPLVFVAHAHLYAFSNAVDNPDTPSQAVRDERWKGLTDFLDYARSKPAVRIVSVAQVVAWMQRQAASP